MSANSANYCDPEKVSKSEYSVKEFDWRKKGSIVNPKVYYQDSCSSCYMFSAVGALESAYMLSHGGKEMADHNQTKAFSVKAFLDCIGNGCLPHWFEDVFRLAMEKGVTLESDAPKYNGIVIF